MILKPSGNFSVCFNDSLELTCTTTRGPLLWSAGSSHQLFNRFPQNPVTLRNGLYLSVISVVEDGNSLSVSSVATLDRFTLTSNGLAVGCGEIINGITSLRRKVFVTAGE